MIMKRHKMPHHAWDGSYDPSQPRWAGGMLEAYKESLLESCVRTPPPVSAQYVLTPIEHIRRMRFAPTYGHAIRGRERMIEDCMRFAEANLEACNTYITLHATDQGQGTLIQGWIAIGFALGRARNGVMPGFWSPRDGALGTILDRAAEDFGPQLIYRHIDGSLVVSG